MKNIYIVIVLAFALILNLDNTVVAQEKHQHHDKKETTDAKTKNNAVTKIGDVDVKVTSSINEIIEHYLQLKNSLVSDNTKGASAFGKEMFDAMEKLDKSFLTADQKKIYVDIEEDAKEHAEHIGENEGNIEHQREHFDMLSNDLYDLVKEFGSGQVLYKDFCPMYNDKKGAIWLSESKDIKNPYLGKKMVTCGTIKEEIK